MGRLRSWKKNRVYRPELLLQQLEERIVLDASVNPAPQDNPSDNPANPQDHVGGLDTSPAADAAAAGGAGGSGAGLAAQLPDSYNHVFSENLNVVLISNNLADVQAITDAAQPDAKVITYDAEHDNLAAITAKLQDLVTQTGHKIDNLAIVGHSSEGILSLGADQIQFFSLSNYKATFEALGQMLTQDAQIQFYGCSLAGNAEGAALVDAIATYTAAEAFASTNTTGGAGNDWILEYSSDSAIAIHTVLNTDALAASGTELVAVAPWVQIQASTAGGWSGNADNPLFTNVDGNLFFRAGNNGTNYELYFSDGNPDPLHTYQVMEINATTSSNPSDFISFQGNLFFTADDGVNGRELWVSDGVLGGGPGHTYKFAEINAAGSAFTYAAPGSYNNFTVFNGMLYFTANDGVHGTELWVTDGTAAPHMVVLGADGGGLTAGAGSSTISNLTVVNDNLYFAGITATNNLWKTDGTEAGTVRVSTVASGITSMVNFNGTLFFSGTGNGLGQELWMSDGTSGGTAMFANITAGSGSTSPTNFTVVDDYLFFTNWGGLPAKASTMYATDGVSAPVVISAPGASSFSGIKFLTESGGRLFFGEATTAGTLGTNTPQMWMYDPSVGLGGSAVNITGTTQTGLNGVGNIGLWSISNANGTPYFSYASNTLGWEVFDYNIGTGVITEHQSDTAGYAIGSNAMYPVFVNGSVFWQAYTSTYGRELYIDANAPWETAADAPTNSVGALGTFAEDTAGLLDLGAGSWSVSDPNGDNLTVKLVASAGFSGITLDDGATFQKVITLTGDAGTISTTLHNLKGQLKPNFFGNAEIDITTTDPSGWSDTDRMFATVTPVPDAPTLTLPISAGTIAEDANNITPLILGSTSNIFNVFDADPGDVLTLTATVGQGFAGVNLTSSAGTFGTSDTITGTWDYINAQIAGNKIFVKTQADFNGTAQLEFSVSDGVNPPVLATYSKVVTAVNDVPVNNNVPIGVQTDLPLAGGPITEDSPVVFSTSNGNLITISDVDLPFGAPTADYTVDLTTAKAGIGDTGTVQVVLDPLHPLTSLVGNGTSHVTLTGTLDNINWALDGMAFVPYAENYVYAGTSNATLQIVTSDGGNIGTGNVLSDTDTIDFTVTPVADTPVNTVNAINVPANASTTISLAGGLTVHDGDVGDTLFVDVKAGTGVTGLGWGTGTTFVPEYIFAGTEGYLNSLLNGLTAQVAAGFSGPATVLITTTDLSGLSDTDTLTITFDGPTSAAPVITTDVVGFTVNEDNGGLPVGLGTHVSVSDPNSDPLTVDLTASAGWSGLNATASGSALVTGGGTTALHISGSMVDVQNTLATLTGTLITDFNGTATFSVTASDGINPPVTSPAVDIPILAVNDAPVNAVPVSAIATEDLLTPITGISISDVDAGASAVQVTLSVTNGTLQVNDTVVGGLTAGGITSNGSGNVVLNGTLAEINATLTDATGVQYLSLLNYNGSDTLTVLSDDLGAAGSGGVQTDSDPVAITVNAVNDAPVNTVPVSATADTNVLTPITGILISDVDADPSAVQVTLSVANGTLLVNEGVVGGLLSGQIATNGTGSVVLTGTLAEINATLADATGLRYLSSLDYVGPDTLNVVTSDLGATGSGGALTDSDPVAITVNAAAAINDPPLISLNAAVQQTDPSGAVIFNAANGNLISVADPDAGTGLVQVTLTATHGTMTLSGVTGLTFDPGQDGTADATMAFTGTLADVNAALNGMSFNRDAGYTGLADVTIGVNDQGNTGTGGAQVANAVENISVEAYGAWFAGFGTETGWQVYNDAPTGDAYYTHDMTLYWWHVSSSDTWSFWNGASWVATDNLGNAPYADGYGPYGTWFHDTVTGGTYENYDVYIHTAATYFSLDYAAVGATYWQETSAGAWSYWDGSAWYATGGFNVEPVNVWFHGYDGTDAGWDVYNQSSTGDEYFTHDQTVFWWHVASGNTWQYWNGTAWVPTTGPQGVV